MSVSSSASDDQPRFLVPLRWRDLDHQGHVYHATMLTLLDEARTRWLSESIGVESADTYVVARIELDYLAEVTMASAAVEVTFGVSRVGRRSITTVETVTDGNGVQVARAAVVVVLWDRADHRSRELTAVERTNANHWLAPAANPEVELHA